MPNILKLAAISSGYSGGNHAVGPDGPLKGFAYPCPRASDRAILPISQPKPKWSQGTRMRYVCPMTMQASRNARPTQKMIQGARKRCLVEEIVIPRRLILAAS